MGPAALLYTAATAEVITGGRVVTAVTLTAGAAAAATAVVRTGGGSGTVLLALAAPQGETAHVVFPCGAAFNSGVHVTLTGADATCTVACS
jgi:predicted cupin superfamily sugar epimerase